MMSDRPVPTISEALQSDAAHRLGGIGRVRLRGIPALAVLLLLSCFGLSLAWGQNDVLTQHNDNTRSGLNANEKLLTPANVSAGRFGKLFTQNVDGIVVAQPLYASGVLMNDGKVHNVVYVATQHNTVYAFDADNARGSNSAPLWSVSLNNGGTPDPISDFGCTQTHYTEIGIMGTPVIDPGKTTLYVVAKTVIGTGQTAVRNFSLHALDIRTGTEILGGPFIITGTAPSSNGSGTFAAIYQMQRPALLLQNGTLYIGFGGNGCDQYAYNGWLFAYNSQNLQQQAAFLVTPDGRQGSIWQGGSGPATDANGFVYVATANGTYDGPSGGNDFGDSVLKLGWSGNVFGIMDYFTPFNQTELAQLDLDLGSSGPLVLPDQPGLFPHELVVAGKEGTLYLINRDNEGQFNSSTDNVIQSIPHAVASEVAGVPSYWNGNIYMGGDSDYLKQYALVNGLLTLEPVSQTTVLFGGAGPASTSITANGNTQGILWAIRHTNPALFAFDPTNLAHKFYDTTQALHARDKMNPVVRFVTPTISNGKVYVAGTSTLTAYGLLPGLAAVSGNNQTGVVKTILPVPLSVLATDAYTSQPLPGVAVTCKDGGIGGVFLPSGTQTTDATGKATFSYQLPGKPRAVAITCSNPVYINALFSETSTTGPPVRMSITAGNNQTAPPNSPLPGPLVIKVVDSHSLGVPGVTVNFSDNGAGGTFSATSVVTSSLGTATVQYTTGPNVGPVTITATTAGVSPLNLRETVQ
jgi:hypothetical protein